MYPSKPGTSRAATARAASEGTRVRSAATPPMTGAHVDAVPLRRSERIRNRREGVRTEPIAAQLRGAPRVTRYPPSYLSVLQAISLRRAMTLPALQERSTSMEDTSAADTLAADVSLTQAPVAFASGVDARAETATGADTASASASADDAASDVDTRNAAAMPVAAVLPRRVLPRRDLLPIRLLKTDAPGMLRLWHSGRWGRPLLSRRLCRPSIAPSPSLRRCLVGL